MDSYLQSPFSDFHIHRHLINQQLTNYQNLSKYNKINQNEHYLCYTVRQSRPTKIWENEFLRCLSQCYSAWWCCSRRAVVVELGFVFLFVVSCFRFSVRISGWFLACVLFLHLDFSILDAKICEDFAKI